MGAVVPKTEESLPVVSEQTRNDIIRMLASGEFPVDADIARACRVPVKVVQQLVKSDPELAELRRQAELEMAQLIEKAAVELAISGRNEIARQKSQEFLLKKLVPEKYGENAEQINPQNMQKRIILMPALPVIAVDENGIPIESRQEVIDV
jgi:hypothetical protein